MDKEKKAQQLELAAKIIREGLEFEVKNYYSDSEFRIGTANITFYVGAPERWEIRIKPWTLGRSVNGFTLGEGQEWHRQDWTKEMLPDGWRPLLDGEPLEAVDEWSAGRLFERIYTSSHNYPGLKEFWRTRRPLPPIKWKAEREALARGEVIESRYGDNAWVACSIPVWDDGYEYRIKPTTKRVPLGPGDVPPGSVFRLIDDRVHVDNRRTDWAAPILSTKAGVKFHTADVLWDTLHFHYEINRSIPLTGKWDANAWEPASKEVES